MHSPLKMTDMQYTPTRGLDGPPARGTKRAAERLSQIVAEYSSAVASSEVACGELTPAASRLKGALAGKKVDVDEYRAYREGKHS